MTCKDIPVAEEFSVLTCMPLFFITSVPDKASQNSVIWLTLYCCIRTKRKRLILDANRKLGFSDFQTVHIINTTNDIYIGALHYNWSTSFFDISDRERLEHPWNIPSKPLHISTPRYCPISNGHRPASYSVKFVLRSGTILPTLALYSIISHAQQGPFKSWCYQSIHLGQCLQGMRMVYHYSRSSSSDTSIIMEL